LPLTRFLGYDSLETADIHILKDFEVQGQRVLVFDATPLYAESGGQMSDTGRVVLDT
jgi:alanyl-tRNA synthetase